jgi:hypothetical protein
MRIVVEGVGKAAKLPLTVPRSDGSPTDAVALPLIDGDAAVEGEPEGDGVMLTLPVGVALSAY